MREGISCPRSPGSGPMVPHPLPEGQIPSTAFFPSASSPAHPAALETPPSVPSPSAPSLFLLLHPSPCGDPYSCPVLFSFGETILSHLPGPPLATLTHLPFPATNLPGPPSTCISHSGLNSAAAVTPWLLHFPWMTQHDPVPAWELGALKMGTFHRAPALEPGPGPMPLSIPPLLFQPLSASHSRLELNCLSSSEGSCILFMCCDNNSSNTIGHQANYQLSNESPSKRLVSLSVTLH